MRTFFTFLTPFSSLGGTGGMETSGENLGGRMGDANGLNDWGDRSKNWGDVQGKIWRGGGALWGDARTCWGDTIAPQRPPPRLHVCTITRLEMVGRTHRPLAKIPLFPHKHSKEKVII